MSAEHSPAVPDPRLRNLLAKALRGNPQLTLKIPNTAYPRYGADTDGPIAPDSSVEALDEKLTEALIVMWSLAHCERSSGGGDLEAESLIRDAARKYLGYALSALVEARTRNLDGGREYSTKIKRLVVGVKRVDWGSRDSVPAREMLQRFMAAAISGVRMMETIGLRAAAVPFQDERDLVSKALRTNPAVTLERGALPGEWYNALVTGAMVELRMIAREMEEPGPREGTPEDFIDHAAIEIGNACMFGLIAASQGDMGEARKLAGKIPALVAEVRAWPFADHAGVVRVIEAAESVMEALEKIGLIRSARGG